MTDEPISIYFAVDNVMAMPLAVTIESILASKAPATRLDLHVLSCGIGKSAQRQITRSVGQRAEITWHPIGGNVYRRLDALWLGTRRPVPPAVFARLLAGSILPTRVHRAIYLDVDVIVRRDLTPLWREADDGAPLVAVVDLPDDRRFASILERISERDRAREGVSEQTPYFNAGVLVMDLDVQRAGAEVETIDIMSRNPELMFADQDALNIRFAGEVKLVDPRWNQMEATFWNLEPHRQPHDEVTLAAIRDDPAIVHYTGRPKPWVRGAKHPWLELWKETFERTPWSAPGRVALLTATTFAERALRVARRRLRRRLRGTR